MLRLQTVERTATCTPRNSPHNVGSDYRVLQKVEENSFCIDPWVSPADNIITSIVRACVRAYALTCDGCDVMCKSLILATFLQYHYFHAP